jgi:colanic acid biosynthesis glycosyl transferase WcaI
MNILMLTAYFPPEVGSASHLFYDLGSEFARRGHRVTILTGYPSYNVDRSTLPPQYLRGWWMKEIVDGMTVVRVRAPEMSRRIPVLRGLNQIAMAFGLWAAGMLVQRPPDSVMLVYSPPLFLGLSAMFLRPFTNARFVFNVQDLFPQSAIDLGLLKSKALIRIFRSVESFIYRNADRVTVHSPGNKEHVERCGGTSSNVLVVPNQVDTKQIVCGERNNSFRKEYGISEKEFVVSFAGVIGYSQDLDTVIDTARLLQNIQEVVFYIVGDGVEKPRLVRKAAGMSNVKFLPMLSKERYVDLLHASDLCLATLRSEVKTPVVPSKILSIMAAGRPVVASMPLEGDAPTIIRDAECGVCLAPEQPELLAAAIRSLFSRENGIAEYGRNGRRYAEQHFSLEACASRYEALFQQLVQQRN